MAETGETAPLDIVAGRHFSLNNGERVVYYPTKDEREDASLDFIGKKLNWITEYYVMDPFFPRIVRELEGNEELPPSTGRTGDKTIAPCTLRGSVRTGLYVMADEGKPPPTRQQRNPFDIDLTTGREFVLDNGERVLFVGNTTSIQQAHQDSEFIGNEVRFNSISGAPTTTPRIVRELKGSERSTVVSQNGPTEEEPAIPYILYGVPTASYLSLHTVPQISPAVMADADAKRTAAGIADTERFYAATNKHPDISTCRESLLHNGCRVIYVPKTAMLAGTHKDKSFEGLELHWNPDHFTAGETKVYIVREVDANERSTVISPYGPSKDMPEAPHILTGTITGGLHTLPPRYPIPAQPPAPSVPDVSPSSPLGHADNGGLFPVVSTTSISAEFKDRLL